MALFGKSENLAAMLRRIQAKEYRDRDELNTLLQRVDGAGDLPLGSLLWMLGTSRSVGATFPERAA